MNGRSSICLVDSGATNNFISRTNADNFGLKIENSDSIAVRLADGQHVQTRGFCVATLNVGELVC